MLKRLSAAFSLIIIFALFAASVGAADRISADMNVAQNEVRLGDTLEIKQSFAPHAWVSVQLIDSGGGIVFFDSKLSNVNGNFEYELFLANEYTLPLTLTIGYGNTSFTTQLKEASDDPGDPDPGDPDPDKPDSGGGGGSSGGGGGAAASVIAVDETQGILLNGRETALKFNADGSITISESDIRGLTVPVLLTMPFGDGSVSYTGVLKKDGQDIIIPFSVYKDGTMIILVTEPGTYGVINSGKAFTDTNGHWAADTIDFITAREIFSGIGNGRFAPNNGMTRAMFAQVLLNIEGIKIESSRTSRFTDVEGGAWYTAAVEWAADNELASGYGNGLFGPNDLITREQMAVMLNNYIKYKGIVLEKGDYIPFADDDSISLWAKESVANMKQCGLITGVGDNVYAPRNTANRANVSQIFKNLIETYVM